MAYNDGKGGNKQTMEVLLLKNQYYTWYANNTKYWFVAARIKTIMCFI